MAKKKRADTKVPSEEIAPKPVNSLRKKHVWSGGKCTDCGAVKASPVGSSHCTQQGIHPTPNITRCKFGLFGEHDANVRAILWVNYNLVHIGPCDEGGRALGGVVTDDPEDVRVFARGLLDLADEMELHGHLKEM